MAHWPTPHALRRRRPASPARSAHVDPYFPPAAECSRRRSGHRPTGWPSPNPPQKPPPPPSDAPQGRHEPFHEEEPLPPLQSPDAVEFEQQTRERAAEDEGQRCAEIEHA